jgi:hypothetical protein
VTCLEEDGRPCVVRRTRVARSAVRNLNGYKPSSTLGAQMRARLSAALRRTVSADEACRVPCTRREDRCAASAARARSLDQRMCGLDRRFGAKLHDFSEPPPYELSSDGAALVAKMLVWIIVAGLWYVPG